MEVLIITKPAFSVLGIEGYGKAEKGPEWIRPLWEQASNRLKEIERFIIPSQGAWGLMNAIDEYLAPWKNEGKYLAGWEVKKVLKAPKGWTLWSIPKQTYAVIPCTIEAYNDAYKLFR
jgi:predicted transcriptional regulator YdeE